MCYLKEDMRQQLQIMGICTHNLFANMAYAVVLSNNEGKILGFNDVFVKMTGFLEKGLCVMCVFDLIGNEFKEDVKSLFKKIRACVAYGMKVLLQKGKRI